MPKAGIQFTKETRAIFEELLVDPGRPQYAGELTRRTGVSMMADRLRKFEKAGLLRSELESEEDVRNRSETIRWTAPRRLYYLTPAGVERAQIELGRPPAPPGSATRGVLAWENPRPDEPPRVDLGLDHYLIASQLRAWPGEWGLIAVGGLGMFETMKEEARRIVNAGLPAYLPARSFAVRVSRDKTTCRLYASYGTTGRARSGHRR